MTAFHGFVDESIRPGWYRLTLVRVHSADIGPIGRALRASIPSGQYRLHLSAEGPRRRRQILRSIVELPLRSYVFTTPYDGRGDDQVPRDRCLAALVGSIRDLQLSVLTFDSRGPDRDNRDRFRLVRSLNDAVLWEDVTYSHRGSRDELLIALPDAIGWAAGAAAPWPSLVESVSEPRPVPQPG